jgi:hypothetical protein
VVVPWCAAEAVLCLENGVRDESARMLVLKPIEDPLAVLPCRDDPRQTQFRQVLGYRRRRFVDNVRQVVHRQLFIAKTSTANSTN